jgi:A/G-specific adenine glycosylase
MSNQRRTAELRIENLLAWYDEHRRDLPWREAPGRRSDPYRVWLSEIMLQQTTVPAVVPYFQKFTARWPTVHDLAAAALDDVLAAWAGLGYYARARNLHACAVRVANGFGGVFPDDPAALIKLPGIGPYTAAAIAAIAFNIPRMPVDGNIERVVVRLDAIETPLPKAKLLIHEAAQRLVAPTRPGDMAQAMMDLGASLCAPRRTFCDDCPLADGCLARAMGITGRLPVKAPKKPRPMRTGAIYWIEREDGTVLIRRRPLSGLLGGMSEFPSTPWIERDIDHSLAAAMPDDVAFHGLECVAYGGPVRHVFTHFTLELWPYRVDVPQEADLGGLLDPGKYQWVQPGKFAREALPSVMKKVAGHLLK